MVTGWLNWADRRINVGLDADDPRSREDAARELPRLLQNPPSRQRLERVLVAARTTKPTDRS